MKKIAVLATITTLVLGLSACGGDKINEVTVRPLGNQMKFLTRQVEGKVGQEIKLTFQNTATMDGMIHNLVVLKDGADSNKIAADAIKEKGFKVLSPNVIAQTTYLKPGEEGVITFTINKPGRYEYICTYPGHFPSMKGVIIIK